MFLRTAAEFSICRRWRWKLWRTWDESLPAINFLMLNPSTADETDNDATVERCYRRAVEQRFGKLIVTNLFAFMATEPRDMKAAPDPVGADNDKAILSAALEADLVVCAWGADGGFKGRAEKVCKMLTEHGRQLHALGFTKEGHPKHPLYIAYSQPFVRFYGVRAGA